MNFTLGDHFFLVFPHPLSLSLFLCPASIFMHTFGCRHPVPAGSPAYEWVIAYASRIIWLNFNLAQFVVRVHALSAAGSGIFWMASRRIENVAIKIQCAVQLTVTRFIVNVFVYTYYYYYCMKCNGATDLLCEKLFQTVFNSILAGIFSLCRDRKIFTKSNHWLGKSEWLPSLLNTLRLNKKSIRRRMRDVHNHRTSHANLLGRLHVPVSFISC